MHNLPNEQTYPALAEFLRQGGKLKVGANHEYPSFAEITIGKTTLTVGKMEYLDLADVLREMNSQARGYFEREGKRWS